MTYFYLHPWEIGGGLALLVALTVVGLWLLLRKRPTPEELERARRLFLSQSGRLVDGMLLDLCEVDAEDGRTLSMLLFEYRIGGVDYECSQDITDMGEVVDATQVRPGFPCTVRYQPIGLPVLPTYDDPEPRDMSHLRPGRG